MDDLHGSISILKEFLEIKPEINIPINISHGVDLNHLNAPQDINSIKPVHWSYNESIHNKAKKFKHSILFPHPWYLIYKTTPRRQCNSNKSLLITPPGSQENNKLLLKKLNKFKNQDIDVLVKSRGDFKEDINFWKLNKFSTVSAGLSDKNFYKRLFNLLDNYENIIACTMSSALIFASSLGKKCTIIDSYSFQVYETLEYGETLNPVNSWAKDFLLLLQGNNQDEATNLAREKLGFNLSYDRSCILETLYSYSDSREIYIHASTCKLNKYIRKTFFNLLKKDVLLQKKWGAIFNDYFFPKIIKVRKNEIDIFLRGINITNYNSSKIQFIKGITTPGKGF